MLRGLAGLSGLVIEVDYQYQVGKVGALQALRKEGAVMWME